MSTKLNSIIIALAIISAVGQAQNNRAISAGDSLKGFDEAAALKAARSENLSEKEFNVKMYQLKRRYINDAYSLNPYSGIIRQQTGARTEANPACTNEDFEQSAFGYVFSANQLSGWTITRGSSDPTVAGNGTPCSLSGCCSGSPYDAEVINTSNGYVDPVIGPLYPIYSVFGQGSPNPLAAQANPQLTQSMSGSKILRLNNQNADFGIEKLSKTFSVTSDNALFQFAYISTLIGSHTCCDASAFQFVLTNADTGTPLSCPNLSITVPTTAIPSCSTNNDTPAFFKAGTDSLYTPNALLLPVYSKWKIHAIDLTPYIGINITVNFIATDCRLGSHFGYVYLDAQCSPMKMIVNGNTSVFSNSGNSISLSSCEGTAVVTPPANFLSYQWTGPAGIIAPGAVLTTTNSGTYTLTLGEPGLCSVNKIVTINVVHILASDSLLCEGNTGMLTAYGLTNCVWNTGQTGTSIAITPTQSGMYTVHGITPNGYSCASSIMQNVVGPCTGISNYIADDKGILLYPNPNNGEFTLNIKKQMQQAELLIENTLGQVLFTQPVSQGDTKVKTKNLAAGIYYYTVTENKIRIATGKMKVE